MKYKNEQDLKYFFKAEDKIKWLHSESMIFLNHTVIILETNIHLNTLNFLPIWFFIYFLI